MYAADEQTKQRLLRAVRQAAGSARGNSVTAEDIREAVEAGIQDTERLEKVNRRLDVVTPTAPRQPVVEPGTALARMLEMARAA
jgi:hypothetical protein